MLIALWARSYTYSDSWDLHSGRIMLRVLSRKGVVVIAPWVFTNRSSQVKFTHHTNSIAQSEAFEVVSTGRPLRPWKIGRHSYPTGSVEYDLILPHWFLAVASTTLAGVPWLRWSARFSLRTLLVTTTLIAVALGMFVALK
jgi:hypothetical protein